MSSPRWRWPSATVAAAALVVAGSCAALFVTNPTRDDYKDFAGQTLVNLATKEVCERQTLPMVLQLWISDCPRLIADQEPALAFSNGVSSCDGCGRKLCCAVRHQSH